MKYILIIIFYIVAAFWHLLDIIGRSIANFFILTWDFKWKDKKFYSYKEVWYAGDKLGDGRDRQVSLSEHYSVKKLFENA